MTREPSDTKPWPSFWDVVYTHGDHVAHFEPPTPPAELVALVAAGVIVSGHHVLDIGCGSGVEAVYLAQQGCRVVGVDASEPGLDHGRQQARAAGVDVDFRCASVDDLPLDDACIDVVIDRGCLHVIARSRRSRYAAEVARVLRPSGLLVVRGAARDDDEAGVVAVDGPAIDALFPAPAFTRGPLVSVPLVARSETLAGHLVVVRKRG